MGYCHCELDLNHDTLLSLTRIRISDYKSTAHTFQPQEQYEVMKLKYIW